MKNNHFLLLSFIMPVFNTKKEYLDQCIRSVLAVRSCEYELLIIDDGSTLEDTLEVLKEYETHPLVKVIHCENRGVSAARNKGLCMAAGTYIIFVDSDDSVLPEGIEKGILFAGEHKDADVLMFTHNDMDEKGVIRRKGADNGQSFLCSSILKLYEEGLEIGASFIREPVWAKMFRREALSGIRFDTRMKLGEDNLFVLAVCSQNVTIRALAVCTYNYRTGQASATNRYSLNIVEDRLKNVYQLEQFYVEHGYEDELGVFYNEVIFRTYMNFILRLWLFHPGCPMKFSDRRKKALELLNGEPFRRMIPKMELKRLHRKEKIITAFLKRNYVCCAFFLFSLHKPKWMERKKT